MKKNVLSIILFICLLLTACGAQSGVLDVEQEARVEAEAAIVLEEYLETHDLPAEPVREYGETESFISLDEHLGVRIAYPEGEIKVLTEDLKNWAEEQLQYYQKEVADYEFEEYPAELTIEYESYVINDRYVAVKLYGVFEHSYMAHPIDIIKTFHGDLRTGEIVNLEEFLLTEGDLHQMVVEDAGVESEWADENLLNHWLLQKDGIQVTLARGDYLAMSEGSKTFFYTYEELSGIFAFPEEAENGIDNTEETTDIAEEAIAVETVSEIDAEKPMIALTFDDGPGKHTSRLLNAFAEHGGKGTFFVIGNMLDKHEETLKRMAAEGHEIAGHSWDHRQLTKISTEALTAQFMDTRAKIYKITGTDSQIMRPPYGSYNDQIKSVAANHGISLIHWSLDTLDWKYRDADHVYRYIMENVEDGDIILCHDIHGTTVDAMERVIPDLISQGYQLVTVTELLSYGNGAPVPGKVYFEQ